MSLDVKINITGESKDAVSAAKQATDAIKGISGESKKAAAETKQLSTAFSELKSYMAGFVGITAFVGLSKDILDTNRAMEALRAQLDSVTGSAESGARAFDFVKKFAVDTPFEIDGLTKSFISLKNFGIEPTKEVMEAMTNQAARLGASQETLQSIVLQLGQAYQKGKLQQEDMVILAERGVPIYELAAQALNKTGAEIAEMSAKGQMGRDAIDAIIKKMGELTAGSNARAMDTLNGKISNLSDAWHQFEDTLLNDKSEGIIKSIVTSATNSLNILRRNMSTAIDDQIAHTEARIKTYQESGFVGKAVSDYSGFDIGVEINRLATLKKQKVQADAQTAEAEAREKSAAAIKQTQGWLDEIDAANADSAEKAKKASDKRVKAAESASASIAKAYSSERASVAASIADLQFELDSLKLSSDEKTKAARIRTESARATAGEREQITALITAIDAETAAQKRQSAAWAQAVDDANELYDLKKRITDFSRSNDMSQSSLNTAIADIQDTGKRLGLDPDQMKQLYDQAGRDFNESFVDPAKQGLNEISEFSKEAARGMQNAFADFLFDPFANGTEGMVEGFSKALRRMVADVASAQIFNSLLGKDFSETGSIKGGLLSGLGGVIAKAFGGGFQGDGPLLSYQNKHTGGIVGTDTGQSFVNPLVFNNAPRYHGGGIAGLKPNEVPTVLLKGEEVLTEDSPRHIKNFNGGSGGGNTVVNVYNNADGTKATATKRDTQDGSQIDVIIEQIEQSIGANISRGTGIAPALERQYGLNRAAGSY